MTSCAAESNKNSCGARSDKSPRASKRRHKNLCLTKAGGGVTWSLSSVLRGGRFASRLGHLLKLEACLARMLFHPGKGKATLAKKVCADLNTALLVRYAVS